MPLTLASTAPLRGQQIVTPFVIVGTGRSGTGYISKLLTAVGISTGHEANFHPYYPRYQHFMGSGEASWLAVPHLDDFDGIVIHQTRHPLRVAESLQYPDGFMAGAYPDNPYWQFKVRHAHLEGWDPIANAERFLCNWYERIDADFTYRVEDMDTGLLIELAQILGVTVNRGNAAAALGEVSTTENRHRPDDALTLTYDDVPRLQPYAERFGYES